jgi:formyltetrahydrofolate synthetase
MPAYDNLVSEASARVKYANPVPSDIEVSQSLEPYHIGKIAASANILEEELEYYGRRKAKVSLAVRDRLKHQKDGNYVVITGINPTPLVSACAGARGMGRDSRSSSLVKYIIFSGYTPVVQLPAPSTRAAWVTHPLRVIQQP